MKLGNCSFFSNHLTSVVIPNSLEITDGAFDLNTYENVNPDYLEEGKNSFSFYPRK